MVILVRRLTVDIMVRWLAAEGWLEGGARALGVAIMLGFARNRMPVRRP